jgi:hypothetical protein
MNLEISLLSYTKLLSLSTFSKQTLHRDKNAHRMPRFSSMHMQYIIVIVKISKMHFGKS